MQVFLYIEYKAFGFFKIFKKVSKYYLELFVVVISVFKVPTEI